MRKYAGFNMHVDRLFADALAALKNGGAEIIDPVEIASIEKVNEPELQVLFFEFKADLNRYLGGLGPNSQVHTLQEVITFNQKNSARELLYFGQELMEKSQAKGDLNDPEYQKNLAELYRDGVGTPRDEQKAFEWYLRAANGGNQEARYQVAEAYIVGTVVPMDPDGGTKMILALADGGFVDAQHFIGIAYLEGILPNLRRAAKARHKAGGNGHAR